MSLGPVEDALEELVYLHDVPAERVRQGQRVDRTLVAILKERTRQEQVGRAKRERGIPWRSCADPAMDGGDSMRTTVLAEEFGEVANAVLETAYGADSDDHLRAELVQVAAVAVAWLEAIDVRNGR